MAVLRARAIETVVVMSLLAGGCATAAGPGSRREIGGVALRQGSRHPGGGPEAALRRTREAVAVIETDVGRGMGFLVDPAGYLLTNRHVIEDADHIESVAFPDLEPPRTFESITVIYTDPERDLALLQVHTDEPLSFVPLATRKPVAPRRYVAVDDPVVVFYRGDESGEWLRVDRGTIGGLAVVNPAAGPDPFLGVKAKIERGQSGGPVLDAAGRAVGIVTWVWRDKPGGFAIPIGDAIQMLAERPDLDDAGEQHARAEARSRAFLSALGRGDMDDARQLTSPSFARKIRGESMSTIMAATDHDAMPVMQGFIAAVEGLVDKPDIPVEQAYDRLRDIVARTGTETFREAMGVGEDQLARGQMVSFFYELGQAYFAARSFGHEPPPDALHSALRRLQSVDAARTFALADAVETLGGTQLQVGHVDVVPGAYAPRAVVELEGVRKQAGPSGEVVGASIGAGARAAERLTLHLRLEWGDWYVASVAHTDMNVPGDAPG